VSFWRRSLQCIMRVLLFPIHVMVLMARLIVEFSLAFYGSGEAIERFAKK
jgi:hypothetical protein